MSDLDANKLEDLLRQINNPGSETPGSVEPGVAGGKDDRAKELARVRALGEAVRSAIAANGDHYTLAQVQELVQSRLDRGEAWEMPEHLAACLLCLEAYEVVLEGTPAVTSDAGRRSAELFRPIPASLAFRAPPRKTRNRWVPVAAAAMVLLSLFSGIYVYMRSVQPHVDQGGLVLADGSVLKPGSPIPPMVDFVARDGTKATFRDGSEILLAQDTRFSVNETPSDTIIDLKFGSLTASVAKQKEGRHFNVNTRLGNVIVVGTHFTVGAQSEHADVYENDGKGTVWDSKKLSITAITVSVDEGVVQVKSKYGQARVTAGQTAVLRDGTPAIEVSGGTR